MKIHSGMTNITDISDRLHQKALAWFRAHPGSRRFVRNYVPGELDAEMSTQMEREFSGKLAFVLIIYLGHSVCTRIPMTQEMYDTLPDSMLNGTEFIGDM